MCEHLVRFAAEHQGINTAPAVRCHEDQVAVVLGRLVDDRLIDMLVRHRGLGALDALFLTDTGDEIESFLHLFFRELFERR